MVKKFWRVALVMKLKKVLIKMNIYPPILDWDEFGKILRVGKTGTSLGSYCHYRIAKQMKDKDSHIPVMLFCN